jgi:hypothetical protein
MSSDSIKPLIFISYAHLDEPDPAEGKICWLLSRGRAPEAPQ